MREHRILHFDMDAFFASVELLDQPELKGKSVLVGGTGLRSVVAACSYEARHFGIHSAMPMRRAKELCPEAIIVRPRMVRYAEISREIFEWIHEQVDRVEKMSIDEAYLDISHLATDEQAFDFGKHIKQEIQNRFDLFCSVGIAPCKFVSKIASDLCKPDALVLVGQNKVDEFLAPLDVDRIPGVGKVGRKKISNMGARTIADLRLLSREALVSTFGKWGERLFDYARGIDNRLIVTQRERKSLGTERTFERDVANVEQLQEILANQAEKLSTILAKKNQWIRRVTIKVRYGDFQTNTRQESFSHPICRAGEITEMAWRLLDRTEARKRPLRLIGLSVSDFSAKADSGELPMFDSS